MPKHALFRAALFAAFVSVLAASIGIYWPGLSGTFLLDDFSNLATLGRYGPINDLQSLLLYVTSGFAGPTGRPIALLSFLIDANNWPADPYSFKYTNVFIHALNGVLLCWLSFQTARALGHGQRRAQWIGLLAAALWLLHPLWVSTTLYVVQRMTLLAATFMLAGLIAYCHGRRRLDAGRTGRGYAWMTGGIVVGTLLATLSKENGALLPLLALVVEWLVLAPATMTATGARASRGLRAWRVVFLALPAGLVFAYLAYKLPGYIEATPVSRDFTLWQRVLTQLRVVVDYLHTLYLPQPYTSALFHDDIVVSTGLLRPWTTLASGLFLAALAGVAWWWRKRFPPLALAVFFFFAGHVLESTIVPLELYFEHRNYAPAFFAFFPVAVVIVSAGRWRLPARCTVAVVAVAMLAGMTASRAAVWGNPLEQALLWARQNPTSARALTRAAVVHINYGDFNTARRMLRRAARSEPESKLVSLNQLMLACRTGNVTQHTIRRVEYTLRRDKATATPAYVTLQKFIHHLDQPAYCPPIGADQIREFIQTALQNPAVTNSAQAESAMLNLHGMLQLQLGRPAEAYDYFVQALRINTNPDLAIAEATQLYAAGYPCRGFVLLNEYQNRYRKPEINIGLSMKTVHAWVARRLNYYDERIAHAQNVMADAILDERIHCDTILSADRKQESAPEPGGSKRADAPAQTQSGKGVRLSVTDPRAGLRADGHVRSKPLRLAHSRRPEWPPIAT